MNRRIASALALLLPLAGLGGIWAHAHVRAQQGTEWDVPIGGYDPRDLLRGHYVVYQYEWPGDSVRDEDLPYAGEACLTGTAPTITNVTLTEPGLPCEHRVRGSYDFGAAEGGLVGGRLFVDQQEGKRLEAQLRDPSLQASVRIRVREDGHITPLRITVRKLTQAEIDAREAERIRANQVPDEPAEADAAEVIEETNAPSPEEPATISPPEP